jgi:hypothetical protein
VNTQEVVAHLDIEIARLQRARDLLAGSAEFNGHGRPPLAGGKPAKQRTLSAAGRQKIADAQRKRWAAQKKQSK